MFKMIGKRILRSVIVKVDIMIFEALLSGVRCLLDSMEIMRPFKKHVQWTQSLYIGSIVMDTITGIINFCSCSMHSMIVIFSSNDFSLFLKFYQ